MATDHPRSRGVYPRAPPRTRVNTGSSPLARGLLKFSRCELRTNWIIPARAGFTSTTRSRQSPPLDHPRSRGVYTRPNRRPTRRGGSSPLARGLRRGEPLGHPLVQIIPARAGFTPRPNPGSGPPPDHPRSRGVYGIAVTSSGDIFGSSPLARGLQEGEVGFQLVIGIIPARAGFTAAHAVAPHEIRGSSPLARGLHGGARKYDAGGGIIPARAGFTAGARHHGGSRPDHPRSRGVYGPFSLKPESSNGSSPLARGLLADVLAEGPRGRIIPARAGFTPAPRPRRPTCSDHPRSRGVYGRGGPAPGAGQGSSPLARGLHRPGEVVGDQPRIIPARAGFTGRTSWGATFSRDHPRSRGVYTASRMRMATTPGSSPLARGLPHPGRVLHDGPGIIPARAGFTPVGLGLEVGPGDHPRSRGVYGSPPPSARTPPRIIPARAGFTPTPITGNRSRRDHPRSRGVYFGGDLALLHCLGSSPLARGLRADLAGWGGEHRIIPARAGFTACGPVLVGGHGDHPRSRGVYSTRSSPGPCPSGSSPLARGLRAETGDVLGLGGIIPARAGFTGRGSPAAGESVDHPRSRGVYAAILSPGAVGPGSSPLARGLRGRAGGSVTVGSSPLARGLRAPGRGIEPRCGIIPARAGFTRGT